jgi:tetratricopeptide (TPR) repeat protein
MHGLHQRLPERRFVLWLGKPSIVVPRSKAVPGNYSLTWPEEILGGLVFLGSFLAVRSVYELVPFLMALGCAAVSTFLALKTWRLLRTDDVYFHRFHLKFVGKLHKGGWLFLLFASFWLGLIAHSGWIRYQEFRGTEAFQKLQIPDEVALAQKNPDVWLSSADRTNLLSGRQHLRTAARFGLFRNHSALAKLAWFEYLSGDPEKSIELLGQAAEGAKGEARALDLYYRGAILNRAGQFGQARTSLDQALAERDNLILARQEKGESLWQLGRKEEAVATWTDVLQRNPSLALTANFLAGAQQSLGRTAEAMALARQAASSTPDVPLYHWMIGLRLKNLGMTGFAEEHFQRAIQLDPTFATAPR